MGGNEDEDDKKDSLFKNVLWIILIVVICGLLIGSIVFCRRKIIPKCYNPVKNIVAMIEAKLMFNSILRSCLQTFLATFVAFLFSLKVIDISTTKGKIDLAIAVLIAAYSLALTIFSQKFL